MDFDILNALRRLRSQDSGVEACVHITSTSLATARLRNGDELAVDVRIDDLKNTSDLARLLKSHARALGLNGRGTPCGVVLGTELYALKLLERPDVSDEELVEAVRWKLKDQIDFPVEQASLDVFPVPPSAQKRTPMVFAAVLPKDIVANVVSQASSVGLRINWIDITELALRNVVWHHFPEADQSVALLHLADRGALVNVSRGEDLHLARRVSGIPADVSENGWDAFKDPLLLQVQRSVDYYESAMGQLPCSALLVGCSQGWTQLAVDYLSQMLAIPVRAVGEIVVAETVFHINGSVVSAALVAEEANLLAAALPAFGGTLRGRYINSVAAAQQAERAA